MSSINFIAFKTLIIKEILRFSRIWLQTIVPPAVMMGLYFVIFGRLIGSQIGDIGDYTYMQYIVPGLILMSIISNAYSNVVSSFYGTKFHRHIEELLISPVANITILSGYVCGGIARGVCVGGFVTMVAMFFTPIPLEHPLIAFFTLILTATLFSITGFINAIFAKSFDDISIIPTFVLTPLTYLGGVFYSIEMLPEFWHGVSLFNPLLYMINLFRYGLLGVGDTPIWLGFMVIITAIMLLGSIALWLLHKGIGIKS